ncbi:MAG: molybdopterin-guanine dinucleotide biosynthesis protein B [Eubacteriales bacterium]|nr:molybdopterin-guanine dinucleotide biosynthesis protein B [Eubacteriales bacterium]
MGGTSVKGRIVAVCGVKNSGKTTLLEGIVTELAGRGMKVAVIKHDGHDFACDIPGTDSYKLKEAGAYGTAVFSDSRIFLHKTGTKDKEQEALQMFPEADVILIEGMKESAYPKIEVIREGISECPVSNPEGRFLIVTDKDEALFQEPAVGFGETGEIAERIVRILGGWNR